MYAREIAKKYAENGYYPIPVDAKSRKPHILWKALQTDYSFETAWKNWLDCDVAIILRGVVCVDFDCHDSAPNGRTYFDYLYYNYPVMFKGAVIEESQRGGIHAYFRWTPDLPVKEWKISVTHGDDTIAVEVKTGAEKLAYCHPSSKYKLLVGSLETTRLAVLPPLPSLFKHYAEKRPLSTYRDHGPDANPIRADPRDIEYTAECLMNGALKNAGNDNRNNIGFWLACKLFDLGLSSREAEGYMKRYQSRVTRADKPYTKKEAVASLHSAANARRERPRIFIAPRRWGHDR